VDPLVVYICVTPWILPSLFFCYLLLLFLSLGYTWWYCSIVFLTLSSHYLGYYVVVFPLDCYVDSVQTYVPRYITLYVGYLVRYPIIHTLITLYTTLFGYYLYLVCCYTFPFIYLFPVTLPSVLVGYSHGYYILIPGLWALHLPRLQFV